LHIGEEIYFLSYYSLYLPGKVIVPMFAVTDPKYFYTDFSLYKLSIEAGGAQDKLEQVWSFKAEAGTQRVDLQSCRFGRDGDKLYFSWTGNWLSEVKEFLHPVVEYNTESGTVRLLDEEEAPVSLDYQHPDKLKESRLWGFAGVLPHDAWSLPSPLKYSSKKPKFLEKVMVRGLGDREFRSAALRTLDKLGESELLEHILSQMAEKLRKNTNRGYEMYYEKWTALIEMSDTLGQNRTKDIFSAAFENDTELLRQFIESGVEPNTQDSMGRTPLMYAIWGKSPEALRLLFENGADPGLESNTGTTAWLYAALNPLRHLYLELWER
ncbi:MAG: ankyrin repeat domain-containing protein, partial [Spirochaetia bacterium]|nr:ankyrin repeat domain-containing protein [Spirochaetia bacterium]